MRDRELSQKIFGIESPREVVDVERDIVDCEVRVHVANNDAKLPYQQGRGLQPSASRRAGRVRLTHSPWRTG